MDQLKTCGCHPDYHELGVHRPGYDLSPVPPAEAADELAVRGAA